MKHMYTICRQGMPVFGNLDSRGDQLSIAGHEAPWWIGLRFTALAARAPRDCRFGARRADPANGSRIAHRGSSIGLAGRRGAARAPLRQCPAIAGRFWQPERGTRGQELLAAAHRMPLARLRPNYECRPPAGRPGSFVAQGSIRLATAARPRDQDLRRLAESRAALPAVSDESGKRPAGHVPACGACGPRGLCAMCRLCKNSALGRFSHRPVLVSLS
jgi:hypothetical protein